MIKDIPEKLNVLTSKMKEVLQEKIADATTKIKMDYEALTDLTGQYDVSDETKQSGCDLLRRVISEIFHLHGYLQSRCND